MSSSADHSTTRRNQTSAIASSADDHIIEISAHDEPEEDKGHEDSVHDPASSVPTDHSEALDLHRPAAAGLLGFQCAPPNVLPPSPPLTVAETRDGIEPEGGPAAVSSPQLLTVTTVPPHMREEDITNWRASMGAEEKHREVDVEEQEEEEERELEGEYDPYDLGYSPVTPVHPSSNADAAVEEAKSRPQNTRQVSDHPLRFDVHPPSPLPWEAISPPSSNENIRLDRANGTLRSFAPSKPK